MGVGGGSADLRPGTSRHAPWRGVNLGGWLLLEPGTAKGLFSRHPAASGKEARSEWELMEILRQKGALHELEEHREACITKADFERIRGFGLNAVRLPLGYWTVLGPSPGEPYLGPALAFVDRAVQWAEECGLQVLLDLHGAPGGESGDAPCGRHQVKGQWHWRQWRMEESLRALDVLARRYRSCAAVTGVEVCNEPSSTIPSRALCQYYSRAVRTIRAAGMGDDRITVVLPLFQRSSEGFVQAWEDASGGLLRNVCFDFHYYHCFGHSWDGKTLAQHLRAVQQNAQELRRLPAVVGEWSLALGLTVERGTFPVDQARQRFGAAQLEAYEDASHGWFFWNWLDAHGAEWDWQQSAVLGLLGRSPGAWPLPSWDGAGEDPLEGLLDPAPRSPVRSGDAVFLRACNGRYVDLGGPKESASARWADRGSWQRFTITSSADALEPSGRRRAVRHGDVVRLLTHTGHFLGADGSRVAECPDIFPGPATEFVAHVEGGGELRHRGVLYLESLASRRVVDVDGDGATDRVGARWRDFGEWQRLAVEKDSASAAPCEGGAASRAEAAAETGALAAAKPAVQSCGLSTPPRGLKRSRPSPSFPSPPKARRHPSSLPGAGPAHGRPLACAASPLPPKARRLLGGA